MKRVTTISLATSLGLAVALYVWYRKKRKSIQPPESAVNNAKKIKILYGSQTGTSEVR